MLPDLQAGKEDLSVERFANILAALGATARLRIVRLLLAAHPEGLVVGEIQQELGISPSTLSHHLDKLRNERVVTVDRQGTFLRYRANAPVLSELLGFFYTECCARNAVIEARDVVASAANPPAGGPIASKGRTP